MPEEVIPEQEEQAAKPDLRLWKVCFLIANLSFAGAILGMTGLVIWKIKSSSF